MKKINLNWKPEIVFSLLSLSVSLVTLVLFLVQTNIMQSQQQASVWPYLKISSYINGTGFFFEVKNNGVGPAIVKSVKLEYKGKEYRNFDEIAQVIVNDTTFNYTVYSTSNFDKEVIPAGGRIEIFNTVKMEFAEKLINSISDIKYRVVYASIYSKEWEVTNEKVKELR